MLLVCAQNTNKQVSTATSPRPSIYLIYPRVNCAPPPL